MKHKKIIKFFNLIEITLALAVVAIGISGIMALFPVALDATKNAVAEHYAADVVNQFMSYITVKCMKNPKWSKADNGDPTSSSDMPNSSGLPKILPTSKPAASDTAEGSVTWTQIPNTNIESSSTSGLYRITQKTGDITDFQAGVRVWRSYIPNLWISGTNNNLPWGYGVGLNIEISWPAQKPYSQRETRRYYIEIFNPN